MARSRRITINTTTRNNSVTDGTTNDSGTIVIDPGEIDDAIRAGNGDTGRGDGDSGIDNGEQPTIRRRRGRKPGSTKTQASVSIESLQGLLIGFHAILATKVPEMAMNDVQAKTIATTAANAIRHYGVEASQKAIDTAAFFMTVAGFYLPRMFLINARMRRRNEETTPSVRPDEVVTPFPGMPTTHR